MPYKDLPLQMIEMEERFKKEVVGNCAKCFRKAKEDPQGEKSFADLQENTYKSQGQKETPRRAKEIKVNEMPFIILGVRHCKTSKNHCSACQS